MFDNNFNDFKRAIFIIHNIDKELLRSCLDIEDILHVTLTGITAGYFLGFSRAFILLYEEDNKVLTGKKGIGPFDIEEANLIWQKIGDGIPIEKLFENGKRAELKNSRFNLSVEKIKINVEELPEEDYIKKVIKEKRIQVLYNVDKNNVKLPEQIKFLLQPSDIVISPILAESSLIGIIFADNAFHRKPITEETLLFLSLISIHTALSLEIAIKYNEIKKIQKELLEKEKFVAIGKVASFVTHEIKNPLVKIGGFSRQILETDDQDKIKRNIKIIYNEILQLEKVFDRIINLISFSEISIEEVNIYDLIKEVIEFLNDEIKEKNIEIVFDLQPIWLKGDSIQLKEVFFNIIKNAVENNKENGKIIIKGEITGKYFKITIEDTGIGISEEDLKDVVKPFFSKKKSGLGLGLTVAKEIVERHKGELMIESKINEGTKVKIFLPMEVKNE